MKAMFLTALRQMELREAPEPEIKKDTDVLLKIAAAGVCGSDVHYYETGRIGSQVVEFPFVVGHECAAIVQETGKAVTRVKAGRQVVVEPAFSCHNCDQCRMGREHTCRNIRFLGTPGQMGGCLCEYIVVPQENCFPTKDLITLEQGALCEPLSIGVYAIKQAELSEILTAEPLGIDCIFECCGQQEALDQAFDILKPGGQLVIVGIPRQDLISFSADRFRRKEITIKYIRRQNHCVRPAIDLIASGKINVDFMITHRFSLEQTQDAFDLLTDYRDGVIKAMIHM
jgi:L-iditol 2-dehydrogenase